MDKEIIVNMMADRGFIYSMESKNVDGEMTYYFMSGPVFGRQDRIVVPQFGCMVTEQGFFQFAYAIPGSPIRISTDQCANVGNGKHFAKIRMAFEDAVQIQYLASGSGRKRAAEKPDKDEKTSYPYGSRQLFQGKGHHF